ncbi:MAG TPA: helix-turn-helix domain-containing protein [Clostridiaceae bacterium]
MKRFRSTIFLRFICSYLLLLVIIISFVESFTYKSFINIEKNQLKNSTERTALQIKDIMDTRIRELENLSLALSQDSDIMLLLRYSPDIEGSYTYYQGMKRLSLYAVSNEFIDNIYIKSNNNILSNSGLPMSQEISKIEKILSTTGKKDGLISNSNIIPESVLYIKTLMLNSTTSVGYMVFKIPVNSLIKRINDTLGINEGSGYLFNKYGDLIVRNETKGDEINSEELLQILGNKQQNIIQDKMINNRNNMVQYIYSEETGLSYITIIPYEQISKKFDNIKELSLVIGVVALLFGIILAYIFSYKNYLPIKKMLYSVFPNRYYKNQKQKYNDEFKMVSDICCSKIIENESLLKQVKEQLLITKEDYLFKLLIGQIKNRELIESSNRALNFQFNKDEYAVLFINIYQDICNSKKQIIDDSHVFNNAIEDIIKRLFEQYGVIYLCFIGSNNIAVIENSNNLSMYVLKQLAINIRKVLIEQFNFHATIGIGNIYKDILSIGDSYKEAVIAVEYKLVKGRNNVIDFKSICHCDNVLNLKHFYLLNDKNKIYNYLKIGDLNSIENELNELLDVIKNSNFPISMIKSIYYEIINTTVEVSLKFDIKMKELITLVCSETIEELRTNLLSLYRYIYNDIQHKGEYQNLDIIEQVLNYINGDYYNSEISLKFLSEKFDISCSYISRMFKERSGKCFADYLNKIRVDQSKSLLSKSKITINEIAINVGYTDVHTYIRNFKNYEQKTPGEYRRAFKVIEIIS